MSLFAVDHQKCKHDGICAAVCPQKLIAINDQLPAPIERAEKQCINCGHCMAACPYGALTLKTMVPEKCIEVNRKLLPTAEQVKHLLTSRRSIRAYKNRSVERAVLADIIDTARYAPTGVNLQPVNWLVIEDNSEVKRLAGLVIDWMRFVIKEEPEKARSLGMQRLVDDWDSGVDRICRGAPHVIVAHAAEAIISAQQSCTIALTYLELAAFANGLGACWAGYFNAAANFYPPMKNALVLPEGHQCFGAMLVGYPQYQYYRIPLRKKAAITWR
ncbi:nitroreductase family protein [Pelotomaculum sp. PtaB.Bin117]|uniref:nitroreductase family protein n=1 Tax=Pelotomaculum sp. PtaB.Bin117 TaxID=1811694 RepID=UPI0009CC2209|nr:nitroreductase family protein [Pelotomaculum sp. PtaB.Bin117]OPX87079.1 MAG: Ferredoxin-1 [Pelotomaculum sp. PtaB.Bin117]